MCKGAVWSGNVMQLEYLIFTKMCMGVNKKKIVINCYLNNSTFHFFNLSLI